MMTRRGATSIQSKSLWGLPGGWASYRTSLARMAHLARFHSSLDSLSAGIIKEFPTVNSVASAKGYAKHVLRPLGVISISKRGEIEVVSMSLSSGRLVSQARLLEILIERVVGVIEIIGVLRAEPLSMRSLHSALPPNGLNWLSEWPIRYRLNWLRAAGAVTRISEADSSERYPQWKLTMKQQPRLGTRGENR